MSDKVRVDCARCGSVIGYGDDQREATAIYREHIAQCEVDP